MKPICVMLVILTLFSCRGKHAEKHVTAAVTYTCPMHPQILDPAPGICPICKMDLVPVTTVEAEKGITFSERQLRLANITFTQPGISGAGGGKFINARVVTAEAGIRVVSLRSAGRIDRLFVNTPGTYVTKGQPIYQLYSEELSSLEEEYLIALDQYRELGKQRPDYAAFLASAKKKLLLYGLSEIQLQALRDRHAPGKSLVFVAPRSGTVTEINAVEGQYLPAGAAIVKMEDFSALWAEGEIYDAADVATFREGDLVAVTIAGSGMVTRGKVVLVGPALDAESGFVSVRVALQTGGSVLRPGMRALIAVNGQRSETITVPATAIVRVRDDAYIYIQTGKNTFKARKVTIGTESNGHVAILNGLKPGETIAATGAYLIYSELRLKTTAK